MTSRAMVPAANPHAKSFSPNTSGRFDFNAAYEPNCTALAGTISASVTETPAYKPLATPRSRTTPSAASNTLLYTFG